MASRAGVANVHEKVYEYVEEALQAPEGFVARVQLAAKHRNDGNRRLLPREKTAVRERAPVRRVRVDAERGAAARPRRGASGPARRRDVLAKRARARRRGRGRRRAQGEGGESAGGGGGAGARNRQPGGAGGPRRGR